MRLGKVRLALVFFIGGRAAATAVAVAAVAAAAAAVVAAAAADAAAGADAFAAVRLDVPLGQEQVNVFSQQLVHV